MYTYMYTYMYICRERERETTKEKDNRCPRLKPQPARLHGSRRGRPGPGAALDYVSALFVGIRNSTPGKVTVEESWF